MKKTVRDLIALLSKQKPDAVVCSVIAEGIVGEDEYKELYMSTEMCYPIDDVAYYTHTGEEEKSDIVVIY